MEMIEYIEERILRALTHEILDVVHDQHIHLHIEGEEVSELVPHIDSIHVLGLEPVCRDIKDYKIRIFLLDGDTDSLCKMSLTETRTAEKEEWVESSLSWCERNALSSCESHLVALTYHEVLKTIYRIELRIHLHSLDARENERSRIAASAVCLDGNRLVYRNISMSCRVNEGRLLLDRRHNIYKLCSEAAFLCSAYPVTD